MRRDQIASAIREGNLAWEQSWPTPSWGLPPELLGPSPEAPAPDEHLESEYEDRYPEPYEPSVYDGTDNSDPEFYSDYGDE